MEVRLKCSSFPFYNNIKRDFFFLVKNLRWKTGRQDRAGPYAYSDNQWVGYDDPKSIREKVILISQ